MTENEFKRLMLMSEYSVNAEYKTGYRRGLRRHFHGDNFGTEAQHEQWLNLEHRAEMGRGYRAGFDGKKPELLKPTN